MALEEYKKKRKFAKTPEPEGKVQAQGYQNFVVQEHHASHLHWDLRISMDGVLKSWAVPKEPPQAPGIKRLALTTEDHPLEYADFEGIIPEGEYGAGKVKIWDKGDCEIVDRTATMIEVVLHGKKLVGTYILFKFPKAGEKSWLFFKKKEKSERIK